MSQHFSHLQFGRSSRARDSYFDLGGRIFEYLAAIGRRRSYGHPLRPAQFQHTLYVLSEKRGFKSDGIGLIFRHQRAHTLIYVPEFEIRGLEARKINVPHSYERDLTAAYSNDSVTHLVGSRVDTHYYTVGHRATVIYHLEALPTHV